MRISLVTPQGIFLIPSNLKKTFISKPLILVVFLCSLFLAFSNSVPTVYAAKDAPTEKNTKLSEAFNTGQYGEFKLDTKYYEIDSVSDSDAKKLEENGIFEDIKDALFGWADVGGKITDKFNYALNSMVNILFQFNIFMTKVMIICLEFGYNFKVIDELIEELGSMMPGITGIKSGGLIGGGLFGNLMQIVVLLTALYTLYVYVVKRAFIASVGVILKTVVLLTISFLVFSNYSSFLKTANGLSGEISSYIVATPSSNDVTKGNSTLNSMKDTLWSMFVDRPYLYLQYGQHDIDAIGRDRITTLMKMKPGDDRYNYVLENEVVGKGNTLMLNSSVTEKVAFTPFYLIINGFVSIPIYMLSIMLVMLQFWFIIIAAIAPFALLISVIPGFNGVAKRYFVELTIPLALKVFFSFFTLFILVLSEVLYRLDFNRSNDITSYVGIGILEFILFVTLFLLRKRIKDIFISGSQIISGLRDATGTITAPIKQATQTTAMVAGAAVGGMVAGPQGAMMGASIGNTAGRAVTGDAGATEVANTAIRTAHYAQLKANGEKFNAVQNQLDDDKRKMVTDFLQEKGFDDQTIDDTISQFEKNDIADVNEVELNEQFDKLAENAKDEGLQNDFATDFVRGIKDNRATNKMQSQLKTLTGNDMPLETLKQLTEDKVPVEKSMTSMNMAQFFHDKGLGRDVSPEIMGNIVSTLESKGLHDVSLQEMETQYSKLEQQYHDGNLNKDFEKSFTKGIIDDRNKADIQKQNDQIFGNSVGDNIIPFGSKKWDDNTPISPMATETMNSPLRNNQDIPLYSLESDSSMDSNSNNSKGSNVQPSDMNFKSIDSNSSNTSMQGGPINSASMENGSLGNKSMQGASMDGSSMNNAPLQGTTVDNGSIGNTSLQDGSMDNAPMNNNALSGSSMDSSSMNNRPMEGNSIDNTPMGGSSMGTTPMDSTSMNGSPMGSGSMNSTPMKGDSMGGSPIEGNSMNGSAMGTTSMESSAMNASKMDSTPFGNDSIQSSEMNSSPMENGGSINSAPIQESSFNNSINRVRDAHRKQTYTDAQKTWQENQNSAGSVELNVENEENNENQ